MKDTRYKVDLSKRMAARGLNAWLPKIKTIAGTLVIVVLVCFVSIYPWKKYQHTYLPLLADIEEEQTQISRVSEEIDQAQAELAELAKRYQIVTAVRRQRMPWAEKLFNIAGWVPYQIYLLEIGLRDVKVQAPKKTQELKNIERKKKTVEKIITKRAFFVRGLSPPLKQGKYLAKIVSLAKKINTDPAFTRNFLPMRLNYTKLEKMSGGRDQRDMIEFELEAIAKW
jgi:hypothetical protein